MGTLKTPIFIRGTVASMLKSTRRNRQIFSHTLLKTRTIAKVQILHLDLWSTARKTRSLPIFNYILKGVQFNWRSHTKMNVKWRGSALRSKFPGSNSLFLPEVGKKLAEKEDILNSFPREALILSIGPRCETFILDRTETYSDIRKKWILNMQFIFSFLTITMSVKSLFFMPKIILKSMHH